MSGRIDIGNVRGIKGDKGEKGDIGRTPSYDDLRYEKRNDEFVTKKGTGDITQSNYYLDVDNILCDSEGHLYAQLGYYTDVNNKLCNSEGYLLDENNQVTSEEGVPYDETEYGYEWKPLWINKNNKLIFANKTLTSIVGTAYDIEEYGYSYKPLWIDEDENFTNSEGEILNENWKVQYVLSEFISDVISFIYGDSYAYNRLLTDISPVIANDVLNLDPTDSRLRAFFALLEGDVKYYLCEDDPQTNIYINSQDRLINTCKYYDDNGVLAKDVNDNYLYVPLEKNALYLYNAHSGNTDNSVMHYDIFLCTKADTVPRKLVDRNDFIMDYNVIDNVELTPVANAENGEDDIYLNINTRGTRGQFYSMDDVDKLLINNVINKLGANNGIAQLNSSGKVPSTQLNVDWSDVQSKPTITLDIVYTDSSTGSFTLYGFENQSS